ncbi:hypothetical protein D1007_26362 [Hordeum vulgare]|nr:hypothetical protein D1007_26362 [Hordeum vulgare]
MGPHVSEGCQPPTGRAEGVAGEDLCVELGEALRPSGCPVLERFSRDISAKRLTRGMLVKEFLAQGLALLQAHSRPVWEYGAGDDELRLQSWAKLSEW